MSDMAKRVEAFLRSAAPEHAELGEILYMAPGGSFASGTNDETSDLDFRAIVAQNEDYYMGMKKYDHGKYVSGEDGINESNDDLDVEVYEATHFVLKLYEGEFVPAEMVFVKQDLPLVRSPLFEPIYENREIFLSKSIAARYWGFIQKCVNRMNVPAQRFKKPTSRMRAERFGFETKEGMNAVMRLRSVNHFLETGELIAHPSPAELKELMAIKRGKVPKKDVEDEIRTLVDRNRILFRESKAVPEMPDFEKANRFFKDYKRMVMLHTGAIKA